MNQERVDPHIGLLHRGTEKLIEHKTPPEQLMRLLSFSGEMETASPSESGALHRGEDED
jgi:hypothetical protein